MNINKNMFLFVVLGLLVICVPIMQRLVVMTYPPYWDEGFYATFSMRAYQFLTAGDGLPPTGTLQLYSILCSFIFSWDINHLLALRICDMFVAAFMAWQMYRLLSQESNSPFLGACIALILIFSLNLPNFTAYGFSNAIFISLIPLLMALRLGLKQEKESTYRIWFVCGMLTGLGILLRESFALFGLIGFCSILIAHGPRRAMYFATGGLCVGVIIIGIVAYARGGFVNIIEAYASFADFSRRIRSHFDRLALLRETTLYLRFLLPEAILLCCTLAYSLKKKKVHWKILIFWLAIAIAQSYEIILKAPAPYQYSICIIGLAGAFATCIKTMPKKLAYVFVVIVLMVSIHMARGMILPLPGMAIKSIPKNIEMLQHNTWPDEIIKNNSFLLMAQAIKEVAKPGDTLYSSHAMHAIYVPSGLLPPVATKNHWLELHHFMFLERKNTFEMSQYMRSEQPDIILIGFIDNDEEASEIHQSIKLLAEYKRVRTIPSAVSPASRGYGSYGGIVFVRQDSEQ